MPAMRNGARAQPRWSSSSFATSGVVGYMRSADSVGFHPSHAVHISAIAATPMSIIAHDFHRVARSVTSARTIIDGRIAIMAALLDLAPQAFQSRPGRADITYNQGFFSMSYQVLARKYRPQKFSEVIGQEHVTRTLKNAIEQAPHRARLHLSAVTAASARPPSRASWRWP